MNVLQRSNKILNFDPDYSGDLDFEPIKHLHTLLNNMQTKKNTDEKQI